MAPAQLQYDYRGTIHDRFDSANEEELALTGLVIVNIPEPSGA